MSSSESSYRAVLKIRDYRSLVLASATSEIGDWLYNVALLVYVYAATDSAAWVGAATIGRLLPYVVLSPIGGLIADRFERVRVMQVSLVARLAVFSGLTVAVALQASAPVVIVLAMIGTAAGAAYRPASSALLPELVGESKLAPAMALLSTQYSVALVAGPALGALILAVAPPAVAFGVNAATFGVASLLLARISVRSAGAGDAADRPPSAWTQFADGIRAVGRTPYVGVVTLLCFVGALGYGAETVLLVVYAEQLLGVGADGYGYLIAASGLGGVLGGLVSGRIADRNRVAMSLALSSALVCGGSVGFAVTGSLTVALLVAVVTGGGLVVADVVSDVAITRAARGAVLGRIYGAIEGISVAGTVLGALLAPLLIDLVGIRSALLVLGGGTALASLATFPALGRLDRTAATQVILRAARKGYLSDLPIFAGAPPAALEQLAGEAVELVLGPGTAVVTQGEPADAFYVVLQGDLAVSFVRGPGAAPEFLRTLGAGEGFGEIGLLEGIPRTATVTTTSASRLLRIDSETFLSALTAHPGAYGPLRAGAATRLSRTHPVSAAP